MIWRNKWKERYDDLKIKYNVLEKRYGDLMCDYADLELQYNQLKNEEFERNKVRFGNSITSSVSGESTIISSDRKIAFYKPQMVRTVQSASENFDAPTVYSDALRRIGYTVEKLGLPI